MKTENHNKTGDPSSIIFPVLMAVIWGIHLLPLVLPEARVWGFNHLRYLTTPFMSIFVAGGLLSLYLTTPSGRAVGVKFFSVPARILFDDRYRSRWFTLSLVALIVFWLFRLPIFLLGDSYSIIHNVGNELPVIFKWSEMGAIFLAYFVGKMLPITGIQLGEYAYGIIAVVSGAAAVYLFCALAYELGKDAAGRLLIFCLSIFAGWIVLFFGYTENYPVLWPFMIGYVYFSVRYMREKGNLLWPTLMIALALVMHMQVLFFLISYPILIVARGRGGRIFQKYTKTVWASVIIAVIAAAAVFIPIYRSSLELKLYIVPFLRGHPATPYYSFFSIAHLMDIANQLLLLVPLLPVLIIIGWRGWRSLIDTKIDKFLLLLTIGGIIFLFIIDPKLGMARDWDLFALSGLAPMLLFAKKASNGRRLSAIMFPALALMSLILAMPFAATNLSRQPAIDSYKYMLNLDLPRSRTGLIILYKIATAENDTLLMDSLQNVVYEDFPADHQVPRAFGLAELGKFEEAMILVDSIAQVDSTTVEFYNLRGTVYLKMGKYARAIQDLERAASLGRYDARIWVSLASAYNHLGRHDRMLMILRKGQKRAPDSPEILNGLMTGFYMLTKYDSALVYAQKVIEVFPKLADAYWIAGDAAYKTGHPETAQKYFATFVEMAPDGVQKALAEDFLENYHK